jgi:hypothetical protein
MAPFAPSASDSAPDASDRQLEQSLRDATPAYLDDAGFSAKVLRALPPSRCSTNRRRWTLAVTGAGVGIAAAALLGGASIAESGIRLAHLLATWSNLPVTLPGAPLTVGTVVSLLAVLACGLWVRRSQN